MTKLTREEVEQIVKEAREKGEKPDLIGVNLSGMYLGGVNLSGANLIEADLFRVDLSPIVPHPGTSYGEHVSTDLSEANLSGADLSEANLSGADLSKANLSGADLRKAVLVETSLTNADLTGCSIYGISAWNVELEGATQLELVVTRDNEPMIKVDDLEVAQLVYLLLNHKKLRNVLNAVIKKSVLILGRFSDGGLEVLQAIAQKLRDLGYSPMLFDFERPKSRNYTETVLIMAGLSRFIIADLSGPSVSKELDATIPSFKIPFAPIIEKGRKIYALFADHMEEPHVLPVFEFENQKQLINSLPEKVIKPAEERHQERQKNWMRYLTQTERLLWGK